MNPPAPVTNTFTELFTLVCRIFIFLPYRPANKTNKT